MTGSRWGKPRRPRSGGVDEAALVLAVSALVVLAIGWPLLMANECRAQDPHSVDHLQQMADLGVPQVAAVTIGLIALRRAKGGGAPPRT